MNARLVRTLTAVAALLLWLPIAPGDGSKSEPWMKPDPAAWKRWQDMHFGMFIHWGPVSLTHREIGWSRGVQTPIADYDSLYKRFNWHHPDFPFTSPGGSVRREKSDLDAYNRYLLAQVRELVTNCGPLVVLWNEVPQEFQGRGVKTIKMVRQLQPDILVNDRTGDGGDFSTPEQQIGGFDMERPWESCMTISAHGQWAWGGPEDGVKPLRDCVLMLVRAAGGNGNVLLNVGPTPEGLIEDCQVQP